jgi:hypothetical protein
VHPAFRIAAGGDRIWREAPSHAQKKQLRASFPVEHFCVGSALVAVGAGEMTPAVPDPVEVARVELVEALARMVNRSIEDGKTSARSALCHIDVLRVILAEGGERRGFPRGPRRSGADASLVSDDMNRYGGTGGIGGAGFGNLGHPSRGVRMRKPSTQ